MASPFGPKTPIAMEAADYFLFTRGEAEELEVEKADPTDGATGTLIALGLDDAFASTAWRFGAGLVGVNAQSGTTYTLVLGDAAKLVECTNASAITLTVPANASVAFAVGTRIWLAQGGAGALGVAAAGGVTIKKPASKNAQLAEQESVAVLLKTGTNTWRLFGDLDPV
jgi:hypothetical protein